MQDVLDDADVVMSTIMSEFMSLLRFLIADIVYRFIFHGCYDGTAVGAYSRCVFSSFGFSLKISELG